MNPLRVVDDITQLIGNTPLLKLSSLSELSGSEIFVKCEQFNPGGSVKDRAALQMIKDAEQSGHLKKGMTIVEGTAGNTGIGLSLVARALGYKMLVVMPKGQDQQKQKLIKLYGAELKLVDPCPFANENHFYHTARRIAEQDESYWWANQFENLSNAKAHFQGTAPEIYQQMTGHIDHFVSVAGTGGTIGGCSKFFKERLPKLKVTLVDPYGSGLKSYVDKGEWKSSGGGSITEGIGIMRLVANFSEAQVDEAVTLEDQDLVTIAYHLREKEGLVPGMSAALNIAGAFREACLCDSGRRIVTILCDGGERATDKLYRPEFLAEKNLAPQAMTIEELAAKYRS